VIFGPAPEAEPLGFHERAAALSSCGIRPAKALSGTIQQGADVRFYQLVLLARGGAIGTSAADANLRFYWVILLVKGRSILKGAVVGAALAAAAPLLCACSNGAASQTVLVTPAPTEAPAVESDGELSSGELFISSDGYFENENGADAASPGSSAGSASYGSEAAASSFSNEAAAEAQADGRGEKSAPEGENGGADVPRPTVSLVSGDDISGEKNCVYYYDTCGDEQAAAELSKAMAEEGIENFRAAKAESLALAAEEAKELGTAVFIIDGKDAAEEDVAAIRSAGMMAVAADGGDSFRDSADCQILTDLAGGIGGLAKGAAERFGGAPYIALYEEGNSLQADQARFFSDSYGGQEGTAAAYKKGKLLEALKEAAGAESLSEFKEMQSGQKPEKEVDEKDGAEVIDRPAFIVCTSLDAALAVVEEEPELKERILLTDAAGYSVDKVSKACAAAVVRDDEDFAEKAAVLAESALRQGTAALMKVQYAKSTVLKFE